LIWSNVPDESLQTSAYPPPSPLFPADPQPRERSS